jgi:hypothetical protein
MISLLSLSLIPPLCTVLSSAASFASLADEKPCGRRSYRTFEVNREITSSDLLFQSLCLLEVCIFTVSSQSPPVLIEISGISAVDDIA